MLFTLVLGALIGGAVTLLVGQWRSEALVPPHVGRLSARRRPAAAMGARGGLVFVPHETRRRAA